MGLILLANLLCYVSMFRLIPAAEADLVNYLWPALLVIGDAAIARRSLSWQQWAGLVVSFAGLTLLVSPLIELGGLGLWELGGYCLALMAALAWAVYSLASNHRRRRNASVLVGADLLLIGILCCLVQGTYRGFVPLSLYETGCIFTIGLGFYGIAYPCWQYALKTGRTAVVAGVANAIPILSVGWLTVGGISAPTVALAMASILVTIGCVILSHKPQQADKQPATSH